MARTIACLGNPVHRCTVGTPAVHRQPRRSYTLHRKGNAVCPPFASLRVLHLNKCIRKEGEKEKKRKEVLVSITARIICVRFLVSMDEVR